MSATLQADAPEVWRMWRVFAIGHDSGGDFSSEITFDTGKNVSTDS
jgi:hypothetical protein